MKKDRLKKAFVAQARPLSCPMDHRRRAQLGLPRSVIPAGGGLFQETLTELAAELERTHTLSPFHLRPISLLRMFKPVKAWLTVQFRRRL